MLLIDNVISNIQSRGGITTYFDEIEIGLKNAETDYVRDIPEFLISLGQSVDRYRRVPISSKLYSEISVFHSSYYRLPEKKIPTVTTVHDFTYERFSSGLKKWIHTKQKYAAIKKSDLIICVSNNTADDLMNYCDISADKIRVIHNGVSEEYFYDKSIARKNSVLFVGARGGYKNFDLAVRAVADIKDVTLKIVGSQLSVAEYQLLETLLKDRYELYSNISNKELNLIYNSALCLLYPSSYEGFGIPILEAMRAGCPVIAINVSSIPEVAGGAAILLSRPDYKLISKSINDLLNKTIRQEFFEKGLERASQFSWGKCFTETLKVYKELGL